MGCGASGDSNAVAPDTHVLSNWKEIHSYVRWDKDHAALQRTFEKDPAAIDARDPKTQNTPLHISAQNGHEELTELLIKNGATINAQNAKGQTPLHMSMSYDYYSVVNMLLNAGADRDLKNEDGFRAITGLEGDSTLGLVAYSCAEDREEIEYGLELIEQSLEETDIVKYTQAYLTQRKDLSDTDPQIWTEEEEERSKSVLNKLRELDLKRQAEAASK